MRREIGPTGTGSTLEQRRFARLDRATESLEANVASLQSRMTAAESSLSTAAGTAAWADISDKPQNLIDWTTYQDGLEIASSNLPSSHVTWNDIVHRPSDSALIDWTVDQDDVSIHTNNFTHTHELANNGTAGFTQYNFTAQRKDKLAGLPTSAYSKSEVDAKIATVDGQVDAFRVDFDQLQSRTDEISVKADRHEFEQLDEEVKAFRVDFEQLQSRTDEISVKADRHEFEQLDSEVKAFRVDFDQLQSRTDEISVKADRHEFEQLDSEVKAFRVDFDQLQSRTDEISVKADRHEFEQLDSEVKAFRVDFEQLQSRTDEISVKADRHEFEQLDEEVKAFRVDFEQLQSRTDEISVKADRHEFEQLDSEVKAFRVDFDQLQSRTDEISVKADRHEFEQLDSEVKAFRVDFDQLQSRTDEISVKADRHEFEQLDKEVKEFRVDFEQLQSRTDEISLIRSEVESLSEQLYDITNPATNPVISGASIYLEGKGSLLVDLGVSTTRTWQVKLNRGQWNPLASSDESGSPTSNTNYPYGQVPASGFGMTNPFSNNAAIPASEIAITGSGQIMTGTVSKSWTPLSMVPVTMTSISATTGLGDTVYNNRGDQVSASPVSATTFTASNPVTYTPQAPVYVGSTATTTSPNNASANSAQSNEPATTNMTLGTNTAYVPNHDYNNYVRFVRNPTAVYQWNGIAQSWVSTALSSSLYTISNATQAVGAATGGNAPMYYTWKWTPTYNPGDLKFTFS